MKSSPCVLQLEKACMQQWRPNAAKKKIKEKKKKKMKKKIEKTKSTLTYLVPSFSLTNVAARAVNAIYCMISGTLGELFNYSHLQYLQQSNEDNHTNYSGL